MSSKIVSKLEGLRVAAGLTQDQMAELMGWTGKRSGAHVGRVERGARGTTPDMIERWIEVTGHDVYLVPRGRTLDVEHAVAVLSHAGPEATALLLRLARAYPHMLPNERARLAADVDHVEAAVASRR